MADQRDSYGAETKFTGVNIPPEKLIVVGVDCLDSDRPELADPDRIRLPIDPALSTRRVTRKSLCRVYPIPKRRGTVSADGMTRRSLEGEDRGRRFNAKRIKQFAAELLPPKGETCEDQETLIAIAVLSAVLGEPIPLKKYPSVHKVYKRIAGGGA